MLTRKRFATLGGKFFPFRADTFSEVETTFAERITVNVLKFQRIYSLISLPQVLFLKILSGMENNVGPDQTLIWVYTVCICHFVRHFGVRNLSK